MPQVKNSKTSVAVRNIRTQLKSGKTRGSNPRDLTPAEIESLEKRRDELDAQIKEGHKERGIARVKKHTTVEADRVIEALEQDGDATRAGVAGVANHVTAEVDRVTAALQPMNALIASDPSASIDEQINAAKIQKNLSDAKLRDLTVKKKKEQEDAKAAKAQAHEAAKGTKTARGKRAAASSS